MAATVHGDFERFSSTITDNFRVLDPTDFWILARTGYIEICGLPAPSDRQELRIGVSQHGAGSLQGLLLGGVEAQFEDGLDAFSPLTQGEPMQTS
jgi:hypothetical protein